MLARYYDYNYTDPMIELFLSRMNDLNYRYYASELLERLMQSDDFDLNESIRKAIAILRLTGVPVQQHFSCIYRSASNGTQRDWKLSELACSLIIISAEPENQKIEEIQQELMSYMGI
ncbi:hypothetical protein [Mariniphaga sp.]|uniref:hypothetical protein n=1 Tax=Mariniphaga sp. TaxID=1954475 RepID=UPI00356512C4